MLHGMEGNTSVWMDISILGTIPPLPLCPPCPASGTQIIDGRRAFVGRGGEQASRRGAWSWSSSGAPPRARLRACLLVA